MNARVILTYFGCCRKWDYRRGAAIEESFPVTFQIASVLLEDTDDEEKVLEGLRQMRVLADENDPDALNYLGQFHLAQNEIHPGLDYSSKATKQDHPEACFMVGSFFGDELPNVETSYDAESYLVWMHRAANLGFARACSSLGFAYLGGKEGIPKSPAKSLQWFQKAAAAGVADGYAGLGALHEQYSQQLRLNSSNTIPLYKKAVQLGSSLSDLVQKRLSKLKKG